MAETMEQRRTAADEQRQLREAARLCGGGAPLALLWVEEVRGDVDGGGVAVRPEKPTHRLLVLGKHRFFVAREAPDGARD